MLDLLARDERPLALAEIARRLGLPKSSALSLLRALSAAEYTALDEGGRYRLGVRSFEIGAAYLRTMTPVRAVAPELQRLTDRLGATSHFAVLEGDEVVYLAKHDPPDTGLKLASSLGARLPAATTAVGKAQLAYDGARTAPAPLQPEIDPDELSEVRRLGYALDEGRTATGVRCVASPVFTPEGCCGAIGVSLLLHGGPSTEAVAGEVRLAAERASARLGGREPATAVG